MKTLATLFSTVDNITNVIYLIILAQKENYILRVSCSTDNNSTKMKTMKSKMKKKIVCNYFLS